MNNREVHDWYQVVFRSLRSYQTLYHLFNKNVVSKGNLYGLRWSELKEYLPILEQKEIIRLFERISQMPLT